MSTPTEHDVDPRLLNNVRLVHKADTCDPSGRPLSTYTCEYHQGFQDALDGWSWRAGRVTPCEAKVAHEVSGLHVIARCGCGASYMSTDAALALGMAQQHAEQEAKRRG